MPLLARVPGETGSVTGIQRFSVAAIGAINGVNTIYTFPDVFNAATLRIYYNGVRMQEGAGNDYQVTGANEITMLFAPKGSPGVTDTIFADYQVA